MKKSVRFSISQLNVNGKIIDDSAGIAEKLNNFFVNVGPDTEKTVPKVPNASPQKYLKNRNQLESYRSINNLNVIEKIVAHQ